MKKTQNCGKYHGKDDMSFILLHDLDYNLMDKEFDWVLFESIVELSWWNCIVDLRNPDQEDSCVFFEFPD
jgi:hypothetical protein